MRGLRDRSPSAGELRTMRYRRRAVTDGSGNYAVSTTGGNAGAALALGCDSWPIASPADCRVCRACRPGALDTRATMKAPRSNPRVSSVGDL